ncbi:MAG: alpha-glucuronidase [Candidatus Azobacteroides sp.]|nr:alpha-glucuronidase [Candidatus Azobacteroides sp.]
MRKIIFLAIVLCYGTSNLWGENGSRLWLRYEPLPDSLAKSYADKIQKIYFPDSETGRIIDSEFREAFRAMTNKELYLAKKGGEAKSVCFVVDTKMKENYQIQNKTLAKDSYISVTAVDETGLLYGMFHLLRLMQMHENISHLDIHEKPSYERRILNHWDNRDGTIERGYAGSSLWEWGDLPNVLSLRYKDYARANASIGINGTVLNNVNAEAIFISSEYLPKVAALANVFRPYGIKVYLSINCSSPALLGGLDTSDPEDARVRKWWDDKIKEIYDLIPDFGGFLVKANSEGTPGPQDYGRTPVSGANMLGEALKPYGGIVMWRAFVYDPASSDRVKEAYEGFKPLDGLFLDNVIIQVKNGPIDFQPREPFTPLFGAMQKTAVMPEFQITQEYLGQEKQLAYLAPLYQECLQADTYAKGQGSTVAKCTDGTLFPHSITAIAGVANTGNDTNWTGHHFAQANWYCFGRLAWNNRLTPEQIADEWLKMTFSNDPAFVEPVKEMMMESREAIVNYMMPLGLAHLFAWEHHYGPAPWLNIPDTRPDWMPSYYHKADSQGIGFDRTKEGSNAVSQYSSPVSDIYNDINACPENLLLWFHHVPWNHRMSNGKTLWDELCYKYQSGVDAARNFQKIWDQEGSFIDKERFKEVQSNLKTQTRDAILWRDACVLYFQTFSSLPIPSELERSLFDLDIMQKNGANEALYYGMQQQPK